MSSASCRHQGHWECDVPSAENTSLTPAFASRLNEQLQSARSCEPVQPFFKMALNWHFHVIPRSYDYIKATNTTCRSMIKYEMLTRVALVQVIALGYFHVGYVNLLVWQCGACVCGH